MIVRRIESKTAQRKKRVAAYARVSTEAEEQKESLRTQVEFYETFIQQNPMWEYVKVYADPGRSGTSAKHRPEFQQMVADAKERKLDIILVKSISRFARNVADAQRYVHELKACEVEVRFEREAISSFDPASDMVFSVLAAVAQEESRSISENVKWSYRMHAEKGIRNIGNNRVLGYDTDKRGQLVPNEDAWIARQVFTDYAGGLMPAQIVKRLDEAGAHRMRSDKPFEISVIMKILRNELYVGDRLLQKAAPTNYLTKQPDPTVTYTSYYITDDHKPIIDRATWEKVKTQLAQRKAERQDGVHVREGTHFLYGKLFCAECGAPYKRRTRKHGNEFMKAWNCAKRQKGKKGNGCKNVILWEDDLLKAISEKLGWDWTDAEHFDAARFKAIVRRVINGKTDQGVYYVAHQCEDRFSDIQVPATAERNAGEYLDVWYEYLPEEVLNNTAPAGSIPLILANHGGGDDPRVFVEEFGLLELAGKERVAVVAPDHSTITAVKNQALEALVNYMLATYPALDASRVYMTGYSMGGGATYSMAYYKPEMFAAIAPFAGSATPITDEQKASFKVDLPIIMSISAFDPPPRRLAAEEGNPNEAEQGMIKTWCGLNGIELGDFDFDKYPLFGFQADAKLTDTVNDEFARYTFYMNNKDGEPRFAFTYVMDMIHALYPEYAFIAWDFMKNFSRDQATGAILYNPNR